jgi:hypothetical protein
MYYKIELKNITIALGLSHEKQEKAQLFLCQWHYQKKGAQPDTPITTRKLAIVIQYINQRVKMLTCRHKTVKKLIS